MFVCMYVCMYVYANICIHICIHIYMHMYVYVYLCVCMQSYVLLENFEAFKDNWRNNFCCGTIIVPPVNKLE